MSTCAATCVLDCPYCHRHVVDVYGHLKFDPCDAALQSTHGVMPDDEEATS